ncbi:hypothetical protein [Clostridium sp. UBA1652]|uniref:hypothetical protein n=1 Tax=Clostridium sp. UBA1652 TaxID=1946348 RepID=UPI00257F56CF|nr:hypothetical protein [Clostridium sp. UBA1652]
MFVVSILMILGGVVGIVVGLIRAIIKRKVQKSILIFVLIAVIGLIIFGISIPKTKDYQVIVNGTDVSIKYKVTRLLTEDSIITDSLNKFRDIIEKEELKKYELVTYNVSADNSDKKEVVAINLVFEGSKLSNDLNDSQLLNAAQSIGSDPILRDKIEGLKK